MTVANEAHGAIEVERAPVAAARKPPFWQQKAFYRWGFLILILAVWEPLGR